MGYHPQPKALNQLLRSRKATLNDLPEIIALLNDDVLGQTREQSGTAFEPRYIEAFHRIEKDENAYLMVILLGEEIIGTCHLNLLPSLTFLGSTRLQIEAVRVATSYQRKGIGEWMIKQAIAYGNTHGASVFQLTTNKQRVEAKQFYERLGFEATHEGMKLYTQTT
ncbi:MAG: GNAT family N-acetyltransferase [Legionellales bacterium]|nr:GNAT family N-acetyltransferase [Legionellales bacterium]